jgi:hypothetical protein
MGSLLPHLHHLSLSLSLLSFSSPLPLAVAKGQVRQLMIKTRDGGRSRGCHLELVEIFEEHGVGGSCKGHIEHTPHLLKCPHISKHILPSHTHL